ncbi:hypothetical protein J2Y48_004857 [Mycoplana sp. BE70]|uniref:hypothetical protein n=1 Tax=Mycoplana sp. BE70 TaxID=2817775 RepID=UPI002861E350|nr:hypothetical protein [Mycoplana sp. BE70]MDR6759541.1 hypothetical protein [Mycoplana sp. BE70]
MLSDQDELDWIEHNIAEAEQRIIEQEYLISLLQLHHHSTTGAAELLDILNKFLRLHRWQRQGIKRRARASYGRCLNVISEMSGRDRGCSPLK